MRPSAMGLTAACLLLVTMQARAATAYGLWDPGFRSAAVRTPYLDPSEGTASNPLSLDGCPWRESITGCPDGPVVYRQSNHWAQHAFECGTAARCGADAYWIFHNNNEPAFDNCNPGPPNASLPRSELGAGLMGFATTKHSRRGRPFQRAHLALDLDYPNPCLDRYGIPFMGIAVDRDRGNAGLTPGALNRSSPAIPNKLAFVARLVHMQVPACDPTICEGDEFMPRRGRGTVDFSVWAAAEWGGARRLLFLDLVHANREYPGGRAGSIYEWNWPIREDFLGRGADLAFLEVENLGALCGYRLPAMRRGRDVGYAIDLQRLFQCASRLGLFREPLPPARDLPITTIGWKTEGFGTSGGISVSVHEMRMQP